MGRENHILSRGSPPHHSRPSVKQKSLRMRYMKAVERVRAPVMMQRVVMGRPPHNNQVEPLGEPARNRGSTTTLSAYAQGWIECILLVVLENSCGRVWPSPHNLFYCTWGSPFLQNHITMVPGNLERVDIHMEGEVNRDFEILLVFGFDTVLITNGEGGLAVKVVAGEVKVTDFHGVSSFNLDHAVAIAFAMPGNVLLRALARSAGGRLMVFMCHGESVPFPFL